MSRWRTATRSMVDAVLDWRDRRLTDTTFQRRSLHWPIARWIARRRMRALFDLCSGFVYSQVLLAATRLDLFVRLEDGPRTAGELAEDCEVPLASIERLLEAAESLRLVDRRSGQRYGLGPLGAALRGNPSVAMMIDHHEALYADLADPLALMRGERTTTELGRYWAYSKHADPQKGEAPGVDRVTPYSELMAASQSLIADQVLSAVPLRGHRRLLDVGGGTGAFVQAALERHPALTATVFDLPAVVSMARDRFERAGIERRASVCGGSFLADPLPEDHDLVSLVRVLHDHDDDAVRTILAAVRRSIAPGGTVLIAEPMLGTRGAEPVTAAYFGFYLMAMGQGRARSPATLASMLRRAGFTRVRRHRTAAPLLARVLTAQASSAAKA